MCNISCGGSLLKHRRVCVLGLHTALSVHPPVCGLLLFVLGSTEVLKIVHGEVTASVTTSEHPFLICDLAFVDQLSPVRFGVSGCFGGGAGGDGLPPASAPTTEPSRLNDQSDGSSLELCKHFSS